MIIVFSGTDGAGKSTQINLLIKGLGLNKKTRTLWGRGGYTPLFEFTKNVLRKILGKRIPKSGSNESRKQLFRKNSITGIWLVIAMIDLFFYYGLYARYLSFRGYVVICDRYLDDTRLDFKRNFPNQFNEHSFIWKTLVILTPTPNYSFLLYVPIEISMERSKLKNEPFPDSPETLSYRLDAYLDESLFPSSQYYKISCDKSVGAIQKIIQEKLHNIL